MAALQFRVALVSLVLLLAAAGGKCGVAASPKLW